MRTPEDIFLTIGVPLYRIGSPVAPRGFRGFNEHDIKAIQDEAFKAGMLKAIKLCHANEMSNLYIWQRIQREYDKLP